MEEYYSPESFGEIELIAINEQYNIRLYKQGGSFKLHIQGKCYGFLPFEECKYLKENKTIDIFLSNGNLKRFEVDFENRTINPIEERFVPEKPKTDFYQKLTRIWLILGLAAFTGVTFVYKDYCEHQNRIIEAREERRAEHEAMLKRIEKDRKMIQGSNNSFYDSDSDTDAPKTLSEKAKESNQDK